MSVQIAGLCFTDTGGAPFTHDRWVVALAFLIGAVGSYTALEMAERLRHAAGSKARLWLAGSAVAFGGGVWAMHFMALLAVRIRLPLGYEPFATMLSLLIVILFAAAGLQIARGGPRSAPRIAAAGLVVGIGIAAMHYVGMAAVLLPGRIAYSPGLWGVSIAAAIVTAIMAMWLSVSPRALWQRAIAAVAMATGVSLLHFIGMLSTAFLVDLQVPVPAGMEAAPLAAAVTAITLALLVIAIMSVSVDRRLFEAARHETEALRAVNVDLEATQREIVRRLCRAGEFRDIDTGEHVERIGMMAQRLALAAGLTDAFAEELRIAAPLHDIGKIGVSDAILLKPGKLDAAEWSEMKRHVEVGHGILSGSGMRLLDLAAEIAKNHHEKWDGSGYPGALSGDAIPLSSRIVAIVDVFDALMSRRHYKDAWPLDAVAAHIRAEAGRHFDPQLVETFLATLPAMVAISTQYASPEHLAARLAMSPHHRTARETRDLGSGSTVISLRRG